MKAFAYLAVVLGLAVGPANGGLAQGVANGPDHAGKTVRLLTVGGD